MTKPSLEALRELIQPRSQKESVPCTILATGLPIGSITQISGHGKTEIVLKILSEHEDKSVVWIEENFSIYPFGFVQRNVALERILFVDAENNLDWVCLQTLKAQIFRFVVIYAETIELNQLRRLQLASEKAGAVTIWLTSRLQSLWPISLLIEIEKTDKDPKIMIRRQRF